MDKTLGAVRGDTRGMQREAGGCRMEGVGKRRREKEKHENEETKRGREKRKKGKKNTENWKTFKNYRKIDESFVDG